MAGLIDAAIPGLIGFLIVIRPQLFFKPSGQPEVDAARRIYFRKIGTALLCVAGVYALVNRMSGRG